MFSGVPGSRAGRGRLGTAPGIVSTGPVLVRQLESSSYTGTVGFTYGHKVSDGTMVFSARGTSAKPANNGAAPIVGLLYSSDDRAGYVSAAVVGISCKKQAGNTSDIQGGFFEASDTQSTGTRGYVEGIRAHGYGSSTSNTQEIEGAVFVAIADLGATPDYVIGCETEVLCNAGPDAPPPQTMNLAHFTTGFIAGVGGSKKVDAGYMVNPFGGNFQCGFSVPASAVINTGTAFYSGANAAYGLDVGQGNFTSAAVRVPNGGVIAARDSANSSDVNVIHLDSSNTVILGTSTVNAYANVLQVGCGVAFPATQVPSSDANTLDDYEEGSFTPTFTAATAPTGVAYSVQSGYYLKVGNTVFFALAIVLTSKGTGGSGNIFIGGLPFTSLAATSATSPWTNSARISNVTLDTGYTQFVSLVQSNNNRCNMVEMGSGVAALNLQWSAASNTSSFQVEGFYFVP